VQTSTMKSVSAPIPTPSCDGEDPQEAYTFMHRFSQVGLANHWSNEVYIVQLGVALTGKALTWYNATLLRSERLKLKVNWEVLKKDFLSKIACKLYLEYKAREALNNLKKSSDEPFYEYFINASLHRELVDISDESFIELCLRGLDISHQYLMSLKDFNCTTDLSLSFQKLDIINQISDSRSKNVQSAILNLPKTEVVSNENLSLTFTRKKVKTNKKCMFCKANYTWLKTVILRRMC